MNNEILTTLTMKLKCDSEEKLGFYKSSLLQGVIMENIDPSYAEKLHEDGRKPYSQSIIIRGEENIWTINTLTRDAREGVIDPLLKEQFLRFKIEHNDMPVSIVSKELKEQAYSDLFNAFYTQEAKNTFIIDFQSPTAFKKDGHYVFYPDLYLIYHSLMRKLDSVSDRESMYSYETLEQLVNCSEIIAYSIYSVRHSIEGVKIPAFMGKITVRVRGTQTMSNFANLLFEFGNYSGIGIKTAIGMGRVEIGPKGKKVNRNE
ncbi:MAG: CRISPR-associated endoribonuclease Cas6 [Parasporobacterium sp.]|nr:CRISPR-associated endoribonuclease Cas6 [Parasporobacterium sp.]